MDGYARASEEWCAEQELLEGVCDVGRAGVDGVAELLVRQSFIRVRFDVALDRVLGFGWAEVLADGRVVLTGDGSAHLGVWAPVRRTPRWYRLQVFLARRQEVPGR